MSCRASSPSCARRATRRPQTHGAVDGRSRPGRPAAATLGTDTTPEPTPPAIPDRVHGQFTAAAPDPLWLRTLADAGRHDRGRPTCALRRLVAARTRGGCFRMDAAGAALAELTKLA